jgi:hypothetical protein
MGMEMAMEVKDELGMQVERLAAAAGALESAVERLREIDIAAVGSREAELEERLTVAEATIASLRAAAVAGGRKTMAAGVESLMAKAGFAAETTTAGALDASLAGLSIEQRIAVKAHMMRAGLVG